MGGPRTRHRGAAGALRLLLEEMPGGAIIVDRRGAVLFACHVARRMVRAHLCSAGGIRLGSLLSTELERLLAPLGDARRSRRARRRRVTTPRGELSSITIDARRLPQSGAHRIVLLAEKPRPEHRGPTEAAYLAGLTPREAEIAGRAARRWTNRNIALDLGISRETVKRHLSTVFRKLRIGSRGELREAGIQLAGD